WGGPLRIVRRSEYSRSKRPTRPSARPQARHVPRRRCRSAVSRPPTSSKAVHTAVRPTRRRSEVRMETSSARAIHDPAADFYIDAIRKLQETGIPFLVGGAFAFSHYSHVPRETKDIDVFVRPEDCRRVLDAFAQLGYDTDVPFPHWLGKVHGKGH